MWNYEDAGRESHACIGVERATWVKDVVMLWG